MEPKYYQEEQPSFWSNLKNNFVELFEFIAILGAIFIICRFFIAEPHKVSGNSMVPNFHDGDYLITNKLAKQFSTFQRGEVIILQNPRDPNQVFIKRLIGFPTEKIKIARGGVYVNDQILQEQYLPTGTTTEGQTYLSEGEEVVIPENQYFVMGDNRSNSSDSREWGPVQNELIIGQAYLRYWPLPKFSILPINRPSV
ncbi:MAG: signal peptidase I [Candidatus Daviesbacteria bacterium]